VPLTRALIKRHVWRERKKVVELGHSNCRIFPVFLRKNFGSVLMRRAITNVRWREKKKSVSASFSSFVLNSSNDEDWRRPSEARVTAAAFLQRCSIIKYHANEERIMNHHYKKLWTTQYVEQRKNKEKISMANSKLKIPIKNFIGRIDCHEKRLKSTQNNLLAQDQRSAQIFFNQEIIQVLLIIWILKACTPVIT